MYRARKRGSSNGPGSSKIWARDTPSSVVLALIFFKQKTAYEIASCLVGSEMCIRDSSTGARFWYKGNDGLWWLKNISASTTEDGVSLAQILDDPGPFKLPLFPERYTASAGAVRGLSLIHI